MIGCSCQKWKQLDWYTVGIIAIFAIVEDPEIRISLYCCDTEIHADSYYRDDRHAFNFKRVVTLRDV
jgi:hypothetical protein